VWTSILGASNPTVVAAVDPSSFFSLGKWAGLEKGSDVLYWAEELVADTVPAAEDEGWESWRTPASRICRKQKKV
jgi:hypothetical protein